MAHAGGRPSEYSPSYIQDVYAYMKYLIENEERLYCVQFSKSKLSIGGKDQEFITDIMKDVFGITLLKWKERMRGFVATGYCDVKRFLDRKDRSGLIFEKVKTFGRRLW